MLLILIILITLMAGGYPALYLSRIGIRQGFSSANIKISNKLSLRAGMVGLQFLISVSLLSASLIFSKQMEYIDAKDLGFAKDEVIAFQLHGELLDGAILKTEKMRDELLRLPEVAEVAFSSHLIGSRFSLEPFYIKGDPEHAISPRVITTSPSFLRTMGIKILQGGLPDRYFSGRKYLINEQAATQFQHAEFMGKTGVNAFMDNQGEFVGVVENFHFASLHKEVEPLVIQVSYDDQNSVEFLLVRLKSSDIAAASKAITDKLKEFAPGALVLSQLVEQHMASSYKNEKNTFTIFRTFSAIFICLATIGLFALFAFITKGRIKEMGIRKTLGASLHQLIILLAKNYLLILFLAVFVSIPIVHLFSTEWLDSFAYRIALKWWYFVVPGVLIIILAGFAISIQCLRVAKMNPVNALKDE